MAGRTEGYGGGLDDNATSALIGSDWGAVKVVEPQKRIHDERAARRTPAERKRKKTRTKRIEIRVEPTFLELVVKTAAAMAERDGGKMTNTDAIEAGIRLLAVELGTDTGGEADA